MDPLDEPLGGELAQVAPDRVLGHVQVIHEAGGDDLAVALQRVEDRLAALGREERRGCTVMHACAWYCVDVPGAQSTMRMMATIVPPTITIRRSHSSGSRRP